MLGEPCGPGCLVCGLLAALFDVLSEVFGAARPVRGTDQPGRGGDAGPVDDLHQQSPGGDEVGPAVAGYSGAVAGDFLALAEHAHARCFLQHGDRFVDVVHDEAQVVPAGVAVPRRCLAPLSAAPLEKLDVQVRRQAQHRECELASAGTSKFVGMNSSSGPAFGAVQFLGPEHVDEEADAFLEIGDGQADVVGVLESRQIAAAFGRRVCAVICAVPRWRPRTRSSGSRTMWSTEPSAFCFSASSMAICPMSAIGWRTVVRRRVEPGAQGEPVETDD